jgi:hypothetical protein
LARLKRYEKEFEEANKRRPPDTLRALGVSEDPDSPTATGTKRPRYKPSFSPTAATLVWVGLESQTGDFAFQPEIPKRAAEALVGMIGKNAPVTFRATDVDGKGWNIFLNYYPTAMHRLNVPNGVPGVSAARAKKTGAVIVEKVSNAPRRFTIMVTADRSILNPIEAQSKALGTYGDTGTRKYGWY